MDFRLTTFNLLAPCYKRMHSEVAPVAAIGEAGTGLLANRARTHRTARESEFDDVWRERALETVRPSPTRCAFVLSDTRRGETCGVVRRDYSLSLFSNADRASHTSVRGYSSRRRNQLSLYTLSVCCRGRLQTLPELSDRAMVVAG